MNTALNMVNTIAWIKHTKHSRHIMKMLITTLTTDMLKNTTIALLATRNIIQIIAREELPFNEWRVKHGHGREFSMKMRR